MTNAIDRLNQLKQYMNYYQQNAQTGFGNGIGNFSYTGAGGGPATMADWASAQLKDQEKQNQYQSQDDIFKNIYSGQNNNSGQMAYVQPQNQQQNNPYAARATQLNNDPYAGSGNGQDISNSLAAMLKPKNYRVG